MTAATEVVVLDEPPVPDVRSVLAAYMLQDGYTGPEVEERVDAMLAAHDATVLSPVRAFHAQWGDSDTDTVDQLALWEDLGRLLDGGDE